MRDLISLVGLYRKVIRSSVNPLLQHRNKLYTTWLATGKEEDHVQFRQARGEARREGKMPGL